MHLLFRNPAQRNDTRGESVNGRGGVGRQAEGAFDVGVGHVHQYGLRHIVEVVAQSDDIGTNALCKMIDALTTEDTAIRAGHSRCIVILLDDHGKALHHFVHLDKGQLRIRDNVVLNTEAFAKCRSAFN